ncbi:MAG: B12-binding domain-containing radical SAM protein [Proteobacteria bacterium]|nr:B12-binding domain-containing radical SAM protein [Pseudomonadota bacterium]
MSLRKVYLIQPGRDGTFLGKATMAPYTLMRLASLVPDEIEVEIIDEDLRPVPFDAMGPNDLVGITAKTLQVERARWISERAQKHGATVVIGGTHPTLAPDEVETWADSIAVGEAYRTWPEMIADFDQGKLQPRYVDEAWANLDDLKPISDRVLDRVDENRHYWTPYMEITRGCPRSCTFCTAIRTSGRVMRLRPVDQVVEEIERRQIKRFFLTDDNFGLAFRLNPDYMESLFKELRKLPLQGWTCQAEQLVADYPDMLKLAREAHLDKFFIGFESANPNNRRELGGKAKGNIERYRQVIRDVQAEGIGVVGLFVFGFDGDSLDIFENTYQFMRDSGLDGVSATILTPYVGTPQRQSWIEENRLLPNVPWSLYDTNHVTYYPAQMTPEQLAKGYDWLARKLYGWPSIAQRGLRNLMRQPLRNWPRKAFASFSTDYGFRLECAHRDWVPADDGIGHRVNGSARSGDVLRLQIDGA